MQYLRPVFHPKSLVWITTSPSPSVSPSTLLISCKGITSSNSYSMPSAQYTPLPVSGVPAIEALPGLFDRLPIDMDATIPVRAWAGSEVAHALLCCSAAHAVGVQPGGVGGGLLKGRATGSACWMALKDAPKVLPTPLLTPAYCSTGEGVSRPPACLCLCLCLLCANQCKYEFGTIHSTPRSRGSSAPSELLELLRNVGPCKLPEEPVRGGLLSLKPLLDAEGARPPFGAASSSAQI